MSRIGLEINKLRIQKGMTAKQLAKKLGVTESFILDIEAGKKIINDELIGRVSKALDFELGPVGLFASEDVFGTAGKDEGSRTQNTAKKSESQEPVQQVWDDAFGNILKTVPVYDYSMDKIIEKKLLPIEKNKVEGYPKEKVFYLIVDQTDMAGFRIFKGDKALSVLTGEIDADGFYFLEYNGSRAVRQVKKLQGDKLLLVCNKGSLITETASPKEVKAIARLVKLEILL